MELTNDFRVSVPPAQAWKVFTDVERIAPLLPGAQLQEVEGDEFRGVVKVKVGPIQAQYKGVATFLEQDEPAGRVVLKANGRDTRGQGNANATITATMAADGDGTKVSVVTDLTVTGKVAQFGRGVLADVSGKLIGQFVDALEADLEKGGAGPAGDDAVAAGVDATEATDTADPADVADAAEATDPGGESSPAPRRIINSPEPEPVDLLDAAGGSVAKRALPAAGAVALAVVLVVLRRRAKARRRAARRKVLPAHVEVPSWGEVKGHLPPLPDAGELRRRGRRAAKKARRQAAKTRTLAASGIDHAAVELGRAQVKAARQQLKAARKHAKQLRNAGRHAVVQAHHAAHDVSGRH